MAVSAKDFSRIRLLIPQLSEEQSRTLLALLRGSAALSNDVTGRPPEKNWLLGAIFDELRRRGLLSGRPPEKHLVRLAPDFYEKSTEAWACLLNGANRKLKTNEQSLLARIAIQVLAERLPPYLDKDTKVWVKRKVNLRSLLKCINLLPAAFDAAFPDYLRLKQITIILAANPEDGVRGDDE